MKIEHFALQVPDPAAAADWYVQHLGFTVKRSVDEPFPVRFLVDSAGVVMIEIYNNPAVDVPDYASIDPLHVHLAFVSDDLTTDRQRLLNAGARPADDVKTTPAGDHLAMLRDPWNVPIQLCQRAAPML